MSDAAPGDRLPPRVLPLLYFGFAHLCLGAAFLFLATRPEAIVGFFYHPRMIAVVHLVTLGWISGSILGAIYLVGPIALRMHLPARRLDYLAFVLFAAGVTGMAGHFWIDSYKGMLWSAGTLLAGIGCVAGRVMRALRLAAVPIPVKLHIGFAFVNFLTAGAFGFLVGLEKTQVHVLPGFVFDNVYAHAHLAALGWATMMVVGTGYRLFPMFLPAAMPPGSRLWASAVLLEAGALGLFAGHMRGSRWTGLWALVAVSGLLAFFWQVRWMSRHPRSAPKKLRRPDFGMGHAFAALGYLAGATILGMVMVFAQPEVTWKLDVAIVYGVFGLLGFLSQMVAGMGARLLPMFAWMHGYAGSRYTRLPPAPFEMPQRRLQMGILAIWQAGIPALAVGLYAANPMLVRIAGWGMLAAVGLGMVNNAGVLRHAFRRPPVTDVTFEKTV